MPAITLFNVRDSQKLYKPDNNPTKMKATFSCKVKTFHNYIATNQIEVNIQIGHNVPSSDSVEYERGFDRFGVCTQLRRMTEERGLIVT